MKNDSKADYDALVKAYNALLEENQNLRVLLLQHGISVPEKNQTTLEYSPTTFAPVELSLNDKIALFRCYFRGREDVFARRWSSKISGKSGYQPVCSNEWRNGVCDKRLHKCAECPNRCFAALSDNDFYRHLAGKDENDCDVIGLYVLTSDNNCHFLCADFDDKNCTHGYKDDVSAFSEVCRAWQIPYLIERSRSGNGAHVWIFFEDAIPSYKARRLGNTILTEAMNRNARISFRSYDRFFPNQDRVPDGGFGNLVALPLQGRARKNGNSIFVDDNFLPYKDQWACLYNQPRISESTIDAILHKHGQEEYGTLSVSSERKPWEIPSPCDVGEKDFSGRLKIVKSDKIYIPLSGLSAKAVNKIKRIAAFKNPEFYSRRAMRLSTFNIPRIICSADFTDDYLAMPRGCENAIIKLLESTAIRFDIVDKTSHGKDISVKFIGQEHDSQLDAVNALMLHNNGVLSAATGFGKTVTAAALIARKRVNTLILVHTKSLLQQWHKRLTDFLEIEYTEVETPKKRGRRKIFSPIGCLDSNSNSLHGMVDIAMIQSCYDENGVKPFVKDYGMGIVDECHHVSSVTFENVMKNVTAANVYGLTATPIRKDGLQPIIFMQCGPIRYSSDDKAQIQKQSFQRYLIPRFTSFRTMSDAKKSFTTLLQDMSEDELRNSMIVDDVCHAVASGRTPIILTSRTAHVKRLAELLNQHIPNVIQLTGAGSAKEKRETLQRLQDIDSNEPLAVVATGRYVGEGFDFPRLDSLFLALPISWKGLVVQYAGRLHRENAGKKDVRIYDYVDVRDPVCDSMYRKRLKGYASIGYRVVSSLAPTLFDAIDIPQTSTAEEQIFTGKTFLPTFTKAIRNAKKSIVISSPKLQYSSSNEIFSLLRELQNSGIEITIITSEANESVERLKNQGLCVHIQQNLTLRACIIDKSTVWYGSINLLSNSYPDDSIIIISDTKLAGELLDILLQD